MLKSAVWTCCTQVVSLGNAHIPAIFVVHIHGLLCSLHISCCCFPVNMMTHRQSRAAPTLPPAPRHPRIPQGTNAFDVDLIIQPTNATFTSNRQIPQKLCRDRNPQQSPQVTQPLPPTLSCPLATTIKIDKLQAYLEGYPSRPRKFFSKRVMNWSFQWLQRKQSAPASCCHLRVLSLILRTWKHSFLATNLCTSQWKTPHPHTRGMWGISEGILAIFSGHLCPSEQGVQQH